MIPLSISISIFLKDFLSILISIFFRIALSILIFFRHALSISIFSKMTIPISIAIFFKSVDISTIDIRYRYIKQGYNHINILVAASLVHFLCMSLFVLNLYHICVVFHCICVAFLMCLCILGGVATIREGIALQLSSLLL